MILAQDLANDAVATGNAGWILLSASLVLLMTPALSLFYGGMSSRRSVLNMMMMSFGALAVVSVIYVLWGWSMSYSTHSLAGIVGNPLEFFGLRGTLTDARGQYLVGSNGYAKVIDVAFQLTFAVISVAIISGALAARIKYGTWLVFAGLWVTFVYFPLAHMVWGGGLLSHNARSIAAWLFGTVTNGSETVAAVSPIDFAGGTVVHVSAGTAALVLAIMVGKRQGFPRAHGRPHNLPLTMLGAGLLLFGWFGFNGGSAFAADGLAGLAWLNTAVAAAAGLLGWTVVEAMRDKAATSLGAASGVVAGLVSITPAAGALTPMWSIVLGAIGGALGCWGVTLKYRFGFDDSLDVVGVHLMGGIWGTIGLAFFASEGGMFTDNFGYGFKLLVVQIVICAVAMAFSGVITWAIGALLGALLGWRVDAEHEHNGIDIALHRESAYDWVGQQSRILGHGANMGMLDEFEAERVAGRHFEPHIAPLKLETSSSENEEN